MTKIEEQGYKDLESGFTECRYHEGSSSYNEWHSGAKVFLRKVESLISECEKLRDLLHE